MKVVLTITGSQRFGTDEPEKTSLVTEGTLEREGDILLLCTDGLTNMVSDNDIAQVLREVPFFDATSILVDRALQAGGQDNITVLLMGVEATEVNNG